jgi:geranylgeranyl pyrophosphate synthase
MVASQSDHLVALSGLVLAVAEPAPTMKQILSRYHHCLAGCRTAIFRDLANAPMGATLSEYFERGKMLRPLLLFAAAAAVGSDPITAIPAAQALELLHGASLIHDDIIDRSKERRGRLSLHLLVGVGPAVVLGDYLILRSQTVLAQMKSPRALEAIQVLNRCAEDCCRGQAEELVSAGEDAEGSYFSIIRRKTASPFVAAATVGGILGEGRANEIDALAKFALNVGICFQIRDDELDLSDDAGLPRASQSIKHKRPTIPIIYLQKHGSKGAFKKYRQIQRDGAKRPELLAFLCAEGVTERLETVKQYHLTQALEAVHSFRNPGEMTAIAHHAIDRDA